MSWVSGIAVYVCIWWVVIFAVLPWGVRTPEKDEGRGFDPGAPERPLLLRKAMATTVIAALLWAILYLIVRSDLISFRET